MNIREEIGKRITQLREEKNMSQKELAESVGITQANISRIEQGKYSVGIDILSKIATVFRKRIDFV